MPSRGALRGDRNPFGIRTAGEALQAEQIREAAAGLVERDDEEPRGAEEDADIASPRLLEGVPLLRVGKEEIGDRLAVVGRARIHAHAEGQALLVAAGLLDGDRQRERLFVARRDD